MKGQVEQAVGFFYDDERRKQHCLRSPIDGRVLERAVEQGEYVTTGSLGQGAKGYVVTLADLR